MKIKYCLFPQNFEQFVFFVFEFPEVQKQKKMFFKIKQVCTIDINNTTNTALGCTGLNNNP